MKRVLSIISGIITGFVIVFIGDATVHAIYPPPDGLNYMDKSVMIAYIETIPTYVFVIMIFFWTLSSFLGGMLASRLNRSEWKRSALITGSILMAAALLNLILIPHPLWMFLCTILIYIPAAFLGGWFVKGKITG